MTAPLLHFVQLLDQDEALAVSWLARKRTATKAFVGLIATVSALLLGLLHLLLLPGVQPSPAALYAACAASLVLALALSVGVHRARALRRMGERLDGSESEYLWVRDTYAHFGLAKRSRRKLFQADFEVAEMLHTAPPGQLPA